MKRVLLTSILVFSLFGPLVSARQVEPCDSLISRLSKRIWILNPLPKPGDRLFFEIPANQRLVAVLQYLRKVYHMGGVDRAEFKRLRSQMRSMNNLYRAESVIPFQSRIPNPFDPDFESSLFKKNARVEDVLTYFKQDANFPSSALRRASELIVLNPKLKRAGRFSSRLAIFVIGPIFLFKIGPYIGSYLDSYWDFTMAEARQAGYIAREKIEPEVKLSEFKTKSLSFHLQTLLSEIYKKMNQEFTTPELVGRNAESYVLSLIVDIRILLALSEQTQDPQLKEDGVRMLKLMEIKFGDILKSQLAKFEIQPLIDHAYERYDPNNKIRDQWEGH